MTTKTSTLLRITTAIAICFSANAHSPDAAKYHRVELCAAQNASATFSASSTASNIQSTQNPISEILEFKSEIFDETRQIYVSLPDGYSNSEKTYPVLYVLPYQKSIFQTDIQDLRSLQKEDDSIPEMIIIGLGDTNGMADLTPSNTSNYGATSGGADKFLRYIKEEVFPYIDNNYRTKNCRIVKGHSIEGLLFLFALLSQPDMFAAYALSSPYLIYDGGEKFILNSMVSYLDKRPPLKNHLYITVGDEPKLISNIQSFLNTLEAKSPEGLEVKFEIKREHSHKTIKTIILAEGLKSIYTNWKSACADTQ